MMDATFQTLMVEQDDRVLIVRVDDPPYNFMTAQMQLDLDRLSKLVDADESIGAVVLTGATSDRYITHFDISDIHRAADAARVSISPRVMNRVMQTVAAASKVGADDLLDRSPLGGLLNITRFGDLVARIMRSPAVWLAAISGPCGGGGLELSVCFDARYASSAASTVLLLPELSIGLTTTVGAQRLVQLMGPARALEFMLEAQPYTAEQARDLGLVNAVYEPDQLMPSVLAKAHRFARRPRSVVGAQKSVFNDVALLPVDESLRREGATNAAGVAGGVATTALAEWLRMQRAGSGDSVFLENPDPWSDGTAVELNP